MTKTDADADASTGASTAEHGRLGGFEAMLGRRRLAALAGGAMVMMATGALASPRPPTSPTLMDGEETEPSRAGSGRSGQRAMSTRLEHTRVLPYPSEQVWPAAVRYLRVDRGFTVVDRDQDAGFILFEFLLGREPDGPRGRGSMEMIATVDPSGRAAVKLLVGTDAGPEYLPHAIAEGLAAKLKAERGQPAPPPSPKPPTDGPRAPTPTPTPPPDDGPWAPEPPGGA
ncbi:hypothetical protein [Paraliomyxa miuraensis]|uniref:hypothetical protein n=1 Tax=Paraliomyxa miuraensis TaxID=376150 RepID=UPI00224F5580|nr:hypothetical protein [Paraliomyxa miuraensis]MCX4242344.1 hypothetical protein [Paraliomyxa miuraensis]